MSDVPDRPTLESKERVADEMERENRLMKAEMGETAKAMELVQTLGSRTVASWKKAEVLEAARFLARQQGRREPGLLGPDIEAQEFQWLSFVLARALARMLSESPTTRRPPGRPKEIGQNEIEIFQAWVEGARARDRDHGEDVTPLARRIYRMGKLRRAMCEFLRLDPRPRTENSFVKAFQNRWRSVRRAMKKK